MSALPQPEESRLPIARLIFFAYRGGAFAASFASIYVLFIARRSGATTLIGLGLFALTLALMALASRSKARMKRDGRPEP